jgi:hydroxyacid-oxoacid transhydrogenase
VPHGFSVILNAPAVFRYTASASPERHLAAAEALGADVSRGKKEDAGRVLADRIAWFMQRLNAPEKSSRGRLHQRRHSDARSRHAGAGAVDQLSPRAADAETLARLFEEAM